MGFVEFCLLPKRGELWVSQMHANAVHVLDLETLEPMATIPTRGVWPKVICADPEERLAYVSNWESRSVSVIDIASRRVLRVIPVSGVPRGLALSRRGYLYVCLYEPGDVEVIDLGTFSRHKTIALGPGAPRHILLDERKGVGYVSDMATGRVTKFTLTNHLPVASLWVGSNLNTLALTSDGKYLFASIRGRNNPVDYQLKGPEFGKVSVIDTDSFQIVDWIWGRNQPTGLALSPDDRFMACTDFLDDNLELYDISRLREISSPKGSP